MTFYYFQAILIIAMTIIIFFAKDYSFGPASKLIRKGRYEEAKSVLIALAEIKPDNPAYYYGIAHCFFMQGNNQHAAKYFKLSLDRKIRYRTHLNLGLSYATIDSEKALFHVDEAEKQLRKQILSFMYSYQEFYEARGWIHFQKGDMENALEFYNKAIPQFERYQKRRYITTMFEGKSPILYRIGMIYKLKGNTKKAKNYFNDSIKASSNCIFAKKSRTELSQLENGN